MSLLFRIKVAKVVVLLLFVEAQCDDDFETGFYGDARCDVVVSWQRRVCEGATTNNGGSWSALVRVRKRLLYDGYRVVSGAHVGLFMGGRLSVWRSQVKMVVFWWWSRGCVPKMLMESEGEYMVAESRVGNVSWRMKKEVPSSSKRFSLFLCYFKFSNTKRKRSMRIHHPLYWLADGFVFLIGCWNWERYHRGRRRLLSFFCLCFFSSLANIMS